MSLAPRWVGCFNHSGAYLRLMAVFSVSVVKTKVLFEFEVRDLSTAARSLDTSNKPLSHVKLTKKPLKVRSHPLVEPLFN